MVDDPVVAERGVLTAPAEAWNPAVRRAEVIRDLAAQRVVSLEAADAAAAQLGVSRRQVYVLVGRGGGRLPDEVEAVVREVLRTRYLTRQRRTATSVYREITRE
jgi:putative transposase